MNTTLLASFAIVAALALVGVIAVESILIPQQQALAAKHGCKGGSDAFFNSGKKCHNH